MQIILAVCVEIYVYNKGFMTRRQRSRSPSWPHWQCRTVKPFYGGDKKLPVSQLDSERGKINWTLMPPVINTEQIHITIHSTIEWKLQYRLYHLKHFYRDIIIDSFTLTIIVMKIRSWWPFDLNSKNQIINTEITISQIVVTKRRSWWLGDLINGARQ